MAAGRLIIPNMMPAEDENGDRIDGAKLYFYENESTTLQSTYTSSALTTAHTNPVESDSVGVFPAIWADTANTFSVVGTENDGTPLPGISYDGISASIDATLASADLALASQVAAAASATTASTAATTASAAAVAAAASAAAAAIDAAEAEAIAGFDPLLYQAVSGKGVANGYAPLNSSNKIPDTHLTTAPVSTAQQAALDLKANAATTASIAQAAAFARHFAR